MILSTVPGMVNSDARNSRCIKIQLRYSCGPGHARLRHSLLTLARVVLRGSFLFSYVPCHHHDIHMDAMQFHFAQLRNMRPMPVGSITFGWARSRVNCW